MFDLPSLGKAKANDTTNVPSVRKGNEVQAIASRNQGRHAEILVPKTFVEPDERLIPSQLPGKCQRQAVARAVELVFCRIKLEVHALV